VNSGVDTLSIGTPASKSSAQCRKDACDVQQAVSAEEENVTLEDAD
jgi:hypothetical protein